MPCLCLVNNLCTPQDLCALRVWSGSTTAGLIFLTPMAEELQNNPAIDLPVQQLQPNTRQAASSGTTIDQNLLY